MSSFKFSFPSSSVSNTNVGGTTSTTSNLGFPLQNQPVPSTPINVNMNPLISTPSLTQYQSLPANFTNFSSTPQFFKPRLGGLATPATTGGPSQFLPQASAALSYTLPASVSASNPVSSLPPSSLAISADQWNNPKSSKFTNINPMYILEYIQLSYDTTSPHCKFKHVFYNVVEEGELAKFTRHPLMDDILWNKSMADNPDPKRMIPILAVGFDGLNARVQLQNEQSKLYRQKVIELDSRLDDLFRKQQLDIQQKILSIRKRHTDISNTLVRVMRSLELMRRKGHILSGLEEDLKYKIEGLFRKICQDQSLVEKFNIVSEKMQRFFANPHKAVKALQIPSIDEPNNVNYNSFDILDLKKSFLTMLKQQQSALDILVQSCLDDYATLKSIDERIKTLKSKQ